MSMFDNNGNDSYNSSANQFGGTQVGGGFTNENYNSSNVAPQKATVPYEKRKLSQITIKQIITAPPPQPEENLKVDGQEISQVVMIAQIESIDIQSSHTTLKINDYTGSIDAKQWHNDDQQQPEASDLSEGRWVRINGRINSFQGVCTINVFNIIPITNHNEITHHFLEVIYAHLLNKNAMAKEQSMAMGMNSNNNNINQQQQQWNNQNQGGGGLKGNVLSIFAHPQWKNNETGCNVESVFAALSNEDVNEIRAAIDELCNDGHIYSTIDDDHYKCSNQ